MVRDAGGDTGACLSVYFRILSWVYRHRTSSLHICASTTSHQQTFETRTSSFHSSQQWFLFLSQVPALRSNPMVAPLARRFKQGIKKHFALYRLHRHDAVLAHFDTFLSSFCRALSAECGLPKSQLAGFGGLRCLQECVSKYLSVVQWHGGSCCRRLLRVSPCRFAGR